MSAVPLDLSRWPARMGVKPGDTVQLMADLTRMAWNLRAQRQRPDPQGFIDAFAQAVGPTGDVLIPTYNYDLLPGDAFDVRHTRSISGALAQAALAHPGFQRTPHALHSFAVAGAHADRLVTSDEPGSFGPCSPFAFLYERGATLLAIDLPLNDALTFAHYVEERIGVPYRAHSPFPIRYTDAQGISHERVFTAYAKHPGHHMDFSALEPLLAEAGALVRGEVDRSTFLRVDLRKAHDVIAQDILQNRARSIHRFSTVAWMKHHLRSTLRTFGIRTTQERAAHAARTA